LRSPKKGTGCLTELVGYSIGNYAKFAEAAENAEEEEIKGE